MDRENAEPKGVRFERDVASDRTPETFGFDSGRWKPTVMASSSATPRSAASPCRASQAVGRRDMARIAAGVSLVARAPEVRAESPPRSGLKLVSVKGGLQIQWTSEFQNLTKPPLKVNTMQSNSMQEVYEALMAAKDPREMPKLQELVGKKRNADSVANQAWSADAVTLGDAWMGEAIRNGLVLPLDGAENSSWFKRISPRWQALVRRDPNGRLDPTGKVYGAPYRWGCTMMAYRRDKAARFGGPPQDWDVLLRPELKGKIGFVESPREFVGAGLKTLGLPYNFEDLDRLKPCLQNNSSSLQTVDILHERLKLLKGQVRMFDNKKYLQALGEGEIWVAVGWSSEVIPFVERTPKVEFALPASGTSLWADMWCVPAGAVGGSGGTGPSPILDRWIDFSLQPGRMDSSRGIRTGGSPLMLHKATQLECPAGGPMHVKDKRPGMQAGATPRPEIMGKSEFLLPLSETAIQQYRRVLAL